MSPELIANLDTLEINEKQSKCLQISYSNYYNFTVGYSNYDWTDEKTDKNKNKEHTQTSLWQKII